ncbi:DUF559 domain-containing protein [Rhodococcus sp. BP-349]|nr:DUF559 domain-containing protein [Rhodococcus sp. BP-363]MBY6544735.1 DUF559 domain-containing protein [Rhodococcus sp. BP-369]MBY6563965.1 DUF559 domain-containing protein [Rhodococcus sp. BP-370]MBY6579098.1 DUF559 domain-containing protein [Rhodococcus sp. BP-364]MBY6588399.1 DUF559 domain-containing protein [Rhodococcus sp. BP-358]MBY6592736.1 DUF559 domain-containing protein [Rhodococcus sp. BP-362]MBY6596232.1 DUF559 domain-containing protein [Rhodococcus sp. BP-359]MBY6600571.1 DUF
MLPQIYSLVEPTWIGRCAAVSLWRPDSVLSHRTAARLHGWIDEPLIVEATVPRMRKCRTPTWLIVHRRDLADDVVTRVDDLPVVTEEQALLDCVAIMEPRAAGRLVDHRLAAGMTRDSVRRLVASAPGRSGNARLTEQLRSASTRFASEPERVLDRALIAVGLRLKVNARVGAFIVDFYDEASRVIIEVDGREFHIDGDVFRRDRVRQNMLVLAEFRVLRYAAFDVLRDPDSIARQIAHEVRRRRHARR